MAISLLTVCFPLHGFEKTGYLRDGTVNLKVDFGLHRSEGVVLAKKGTDNGDIFVISLFFEKTPFHSRVVSKERFAQVYGELHSFVEAEKARSAEAVYCSQQLKIAYLAGGTGRSNRQLCFDGMSSENRKRFIAWYQGIKNS